ncbi:unnamed protein product, partial [Owenia fusiformis]
DDELPHNLRFHPNRPPGIQFRVQTQKEIQEHSTPLSFYRKFFPNGIMERLVQNTNVYARIQIIAKTSYANHDGSWEGRLDMHSPKTDVLNNFLVLNSQLIQ